jgi:hypothetical protein
VLSLRLPDVFILSLCFGLVSGLLGSVAKAQPQKVTVCYDFSCKTEQEVSLSGDEWRSVTGWFRPAPLSAEEERERLRQAVGWLEVVVGRHTPTHNDLGLNYEKNPTAPGQLDCIDESLNITTYMTLFKEQGYLRFHRIVERAYRQFGFYAHWAGQIEEIESGRRFVIDSWFQDNGMLPYVADSIEWHDMTNAETIIFPIQN